MFVFESISAIHAKSLHSLLLNLSILTVVKAHLNSMLLINLLTFFKEEIDIICREKTHLRYSRHFAVACLRCWRQSLRI